MQRFTYPVDIEQTDEHEYLVTFPDVPEAITSGETLQDAWAQAADALEEAIAGRINRNEALPEPSRYRKGGTAVCVPLNTALKAAVYEAWRLAGISRTELATRLGVNEKVVRRLLDPHHKTKVDKVEQVLGALNAKVEIGMRVDC